MVSIKLPSMQSLKTPAFVAGGVLFGAWVGQRFGFVGFVVGGVAGYYLGTWADKNVKW